jgi:aminoglycoside phosphotransferase (APT) family kinase protein
MTAAITAFIARRWSVPESRLNVDVQPLQGGLESAVARARISIDDDTFRIPPEVVVKQLFGELAREADVYEALWQHLVRPPAVQMFGREVSGDATYLYLEHAASFSPWPWPDTMVAARVCRELARLHDSRRLPREPFAWNYEHQLMRSAEETLAFAAVARDASGGKLWWRLGDLRRVVGALPRIRHRLLADGGTIIHGDMHSGNVIVRAGSDDVDVVFIDWARARIGSPLEDIASWLHSLGCWEPQARRRHDTLMRAYLESRQVRRRFDPAVRVDYWFASVSNGLSGAIRYHLAVLANPVEAPAAHASSRLALTAWERVVRRAAALLNTNLEC